MIQVQSRVIREILEEEIGPERDILTRRLGKYWKYISEFQTPLLQVEIDDFLSAYAYIEHRTQQLMQKILDPSDAQYFKNKHDRIELVGYVHEMLGGLHDMIGQVLQNTSFRAQYLTGSFEYLERLNITYSGQLPYYEKARFEAQTSKEVQKALESFRRAAMRPIYLWKKQIHIHQKQVQDYSLSEGLGNVPPEAIDTHSSLAPDLDRNLYRPFDARLGRYALDQAIFSDHFTQELRSIYASFLDEQKRFMSLLHWFGLQKYYHPFDPKLPEIYEREEGIVFRFQPYQIPV